MTRSAEIRSAHEHAREKVTREIGPAGRFLARISLVMRKRGTDFRATPRKEAGGVLTLVLLAGLAWGDVTASVDTVSAQAGESVAVGVDVSAPGTVVVGAVQLTLTYDSAALDVTSVDWLPSGAGATARHAEDIDADAGRIGLAAFAPTGATVADCSWRLNVTVSAAAGTYDLRIVSGGTPDDGASFRTDSVSEGDSLAVVHGAVEVIDLRARDIVATTQTNGTIAVSWIDPTDRDIGYRVERVTLDDTPAGEWVVDNLEAEYQGNWTVSTSIDTYYGPNYQHDDNTDHGNKWARFHVGATNDFRAEVSLWWTANPNRASNVPITVHAADGDHALTVNEKTDGSQWNSIGTYDFTTNGYIEFGNTAANGYVIVDAVKFSAFVIHPRETVATVGVGVVSLVDTGVVAGTSYRYLIHTLLPEGDGPSADSTIVTVPEAGSASYTLTVLSGSGDGGYPTGSTVRIECDTPPGDMVFAAWTGGTAVVTDTLSANTTLSMPSNAVTVGATYQPADGDGDGMDDAWELDAFGSANAPLGNAKGDVDGDTFLNYEEHRAGTDPTDAASLLVIDGLTAGRAISWQSAAGATYALQWAPTVTGAWTIVTNAVPATPPTNSVSLTAGPRAGFYRVVVE